MRNVVMNLKWNSDSYFMFFSNCIHLHVCRCGDDGGLNSTRAAVFFCPATKKVERNRELGMCP